MNDFIRKLFIRANKRISNSYQHLKLESIPKIFQICSIVGKFYKQLFDIPIVCTIFFYNSYVKFPGLLQVFEISSNNNKSFADGTASVIYHFYSCTIIIGLFVVVAAFDVRFTFINEERLD